MASLEEQWRMWSAIYEEWTLDDLTANSAGEAGVTHGLFGFTKLEL